MKSFYISTVFVALSLGVAQAQIPETKLTPSDSEARDRFGFSVALDGDYLLVGAPGADANTGAVYVFMLSDTGWVEQTKLMAADGSGDEEPNNFGVAVALKSDYALIGATLIPGQGADKGAAYVFTRTDTGWVQQTALTPENPMDGDRFGSAVSLSGDFALVGAPGPPTGSRSEGVAHIFERKEGDWVLTTRLTASDAIEEQHLGSSVRLSGDYAFCGAPRFERGETYVFMREGSVWQEEAKLIPGDELRRQRFGTALAVSGDYAIIAARFWSAGRGKAYVFQNIQNDWIEQDEITPNFFDSEENAFFGSSVSLFDDYVLIGAYLKDEDHEDQGAAYLFMRTKNGWEEQLKLTASDAVGGETLGWATAFSGNIGIVGAPARFGTAPGAVYIYDLSTVVSVQEQPSALPETFTLEQNFPNPFNPSTVIRYQLPNNSQVELTIYNAVGQRIKTLVNEEQAAGSYQIEWDGTDEQGASVASGVYLYRLKTGEFVETRKMILMR